MTGLELSSNILDSIISKTVLAYSSYSKLVYDVTTGHLTSRFEIFWRETANWQDGNRNIHNCAESSGITACMWVKICIGHYGLYLGRYGEVEGS